MKAYIVILLLATCCGLLAWTAWKITILVRALPGVMVEFHQGVDRIVREVPPAIYIPPPIPEDWREAAEAFVANCKKRPDESKTVVYPRGMYEILSRNSTGDLVHHSWRASGHPDLAEAVSHPDMAIRRPDGVVEGDSQC